MTTSSIQFTNLPRDCQLEITNKLPIQAVFSLAACSKTCRRLAFDEMCFREIASLRTFFRSLMENAQIAFTQRAHSFQQAITVLQTALNKNKKDSGDEFFETLPGEVQDTILVYLSSKKKEYSSETFLPSMSAESFQAVVEDLRSSIISNTDLEKDSFNALKETKIQTINDLASAKTYQDIQNSFKKSHQQAVQILRTLDINDSHMTYHICDHTKKHPAFLDLFFHISLPRYERTLNDLLETPSSPIKDESLFSLFFSFASLNNFQNALKSANGISDQEARNHLYAYRVYSFLEKKQLSLAEEAVGKIDDETIRNSVISLIQEYREHNDLPTEDKKINHPLVRFLLKQDWIFPSTFEKEHNDTTTEACEEKEFLFRRYHRNARIAAVHGDKELAKEWLQIICDERLRSDAIGTIIKDLSYSKDNVQSIVEYADELSDKKKQLQFITDACIHMHRCYTEKKDYTSVCEIGKFFALKLHDFSLHDFSITDDNMIVHHRDNYLENFTYTFEDMMSEKKYDCALEAAKTPFHPPLEWDLHCTLFCNLFDDKDDRIVKVVQNMATFLQKHKEVLLDFPDDILEQLTDNLTKLKDLFSSNKEDIETLIQTISLKRTSSDS